MMRALHARASGPDAVIIGCFGDPGLAALREMLGCPVVGPLEASFLTAAQLGHHVGIVTVVDGVIPVLDHLVRGMGLSLRYAGAVAVDIPVLELHAAGADLAARIAAAARRLIDTRDADVLVLGCMSMAFQGVAERVSDLCGLPVVNPARCALAAAEALVSQGLRQSRRAYPVPRKPIVVETS
jgi:allantoin racemase